MLRFIHVHLCQCVVSTQRRNMEKPGLQGPNDLAFPLPARTEGEKEEGRSVGSRALTKASEGGTWEAGQT